MSSILSVVAPLALSALAPGLGTAIGAGLGAGASWAPIVGQGLLGAATGGISGGNLKSALLGGVTGAGGAAVSQGLNGQGFLSGLKDVGDTIGSGITNLTGIGADGGAVGRAVSSLTGGGSTADGAGDFNDVISSNSSRANALTGAATPISAGGAASSYGGTGSSYTNAANLFGGINSAIANNNAEEDLLKSQGKSLEALTPYLQSGQASNGRLNTLLGLNGGDASASDYGELAKPFTPGDLTQDPGYQFQLEQGNQALDRAASARGNVFSGAALKAAQDYGQGLADQTYNDAYARDRAYKSDIYSRYAAGADDGQRAAASAAGIYDNQGNIKANAGVTNSNLINSTVSSLLSGTGARQIVGRDAKGNPIYADDSQYKKASS